MPADAPTPELCPFCIERLKLAATHGHVDPEWTERTSRDLARQCCDYARRHP